MFASTSNPEESHTPTKFDHVYALEGGVRLHAGRLAL